MVKTNEKIEELVNDSPLQEDSTETVLVGLSEEINEEKYDETILKLLERDPNKDAEVVTHLGFGIYKVQASPVLINAAIEEDVSFIEFIETPGEEGSLKAYRL